MLNCFGLTELRIKFLVVSSDTNTHDHCILITSYKKDMLTLFIS